ncbi:MAG: hypothetical protein ACHQ2E_03525 [Gemmatimonadales bacterium]
MTAEGGLDVLITTEARLAEQLAAAEAEARAIREAARVAIEAEESGYAVELAAATVELAARSAEQCRTEIARLEAAAEVAVRRYQELSRQRGEELAARVVRRVLAEWSPGASP